MLCYSIPQRDRQTSCQIMPKYIAEFWQNWVKAETDSIFGNTAILWLWFLEMFNFEPKKIINFLRIFFNSKSWMFENKVFYMTLRISSKHLLCHLLLEILLHPKYPYFATVTGKLAPGIAPVHTSQLASNIGLDICPIYARKNMRIW